jgi:hypothetical protein
MCDLVHTGEKIHKWVEARGKTHLQRTAGDLRSQIVAGVCE